MSWSSAYEHLRSLRRLVVVLLLTAPFTVHAAERPLARFVSTETMPAELAPLLQKVLDSVGPAETFDVEDDERLLQRLRANASEALATEGYFAPRIDADPDADNNARYVLRLTLGPRARVSAVQIEMTGPIQADAPRVRQLIASWQLGAGQPFRDDAWSTAKSRLLGAVRERDFAAARLTDSKAEVDFEKATVALRIEIDSGPNFTMGPLEVKGLKRYEPLLVERYNPFAVGDRYDAAKLLEFQRLLQQTAYFSSVIVDIDTESGAYDKVPIRVEVTEAQTKRIALGVAFSTDTGPGVEATYRQALLFGYPYTLLTGTGIDRTRGVAFADILLPPKPNGARDSFGVLIETTDIENVLTRRWAIAATRDALRTTDAATYDTQLGLKFQSEARRLSGSIDPEQVNDVLSTTYTWTRRAVDQITDPKSGDILTVSGTVGLRRTSGNPLQESFVRGYGRYQRYVPLSKRDQLILRAEAGHVVVDDPSLVPNEFLFRAGGVGSVRGYAYQSLGVRTGTATTGSRSLVTGSAEYVRWLTDAWGAATFFDAGNADDDIRNVHLARGYGIGARWKTLAGPLALDVAYGERDEHWRVHFFIAIAF